MRRFWLFLGTVALSVTLTLGCTPGGGNVPDTNEQASSASMVVDAGVASASYACDELPLERAGVSLHLGRIQREGAKPTRDILLVHGVTYSSHEFDIDYQDYSLARFLACRGYAVWSLDIAGFGHSDVVEDGFLPDSQYASEDINAAVERIVEETGHGKVDVLGWSWGTITTSLYAKNHPEHLGKLVLYAPILSGIGATDVAEPFHHNTWEHAASDFQMTEDGAYDLSVTDPVIIEEFCSSCWHHDGESSPNGGRRDICVPQNELLIDLKAISVPTLLIHGDADPYLNYELLEDALDELPDGSDHVVIHGGSHVVMIEAPYYHEFQGAVAGFLGGDVNA